jgi:hypothetical protein
VIVVKADYGEASLRRLGEPHAYSQAEKKNQEEQLFHGSAFLKTGQMGIPARDSTTNRDGGNSPLRNSRI